jgi:hypothetical protein
VPFFAAPGCDGWPLVILIAFTAVEHQTELLTLGQRATPIYEGTVEQLAP